MVLGYGNVNYKGISFHFRDEGDTEEIVYWQILRNHHEGEISTWYVVGLPVRGFAVCVVEVWWFRIGEDEVLLSPLVLQDSL